MKNKFQHGDIVCARSHPKARLFVRRCVDDVYYCYVVNSNPTQELSFHERFLMASANPADQHSDASGD